MPNRPARRRDPESSRSHVVKAEAALARGDIPAAVNDLESAFRCDDTNEELPLLAAGLHFRQGDLDRAARSALEAVGIRPFNPSALHLLGVACLDAGRGDLARKILRRVRRQAPGLRQAKRSLKLAQRAPRRGFLDEPHGSSRAAERKLPTEEIVDLLDPKPLRLTACILVTDDAISLDACIAAADQLADEIVVIDASPQALPSQRGDVTVQRCSGAEDPVAARNELLRLASGDWVLILEATEHLDAASAPGLRNLLDQPRALSHSVVVRDTTDGTEHRETRLVRNAPGIRFDGAMPPRLDASVGDLGNRWGLSANASDVVIMGTPTQPAADYWRPDMEAIRRALENGSGDGFAALPHRLLEARAALAEGHPERARTALESAGSVVGPEIEELITLKGLALLRSQRFAELAELIGGFHRTHDPTHNTLFLAGVALRACGDSKGAVRALRRSAESRQRAAWLPPLPETRGPALFNILGAALIDLGDLAAARDAFEQALNCDPDNLEARLALLSLRMAAGEVEDSLSELDRLVEKHGHHPRIWLLGGAVLASDARLAPTVLHWIEEACRRFPHHAGLQGQLCQAQLRCGEVAEGLKAWNGRTPATAAERAEVFAARLATGEEVPEVPEAEREAARDAVIGWFGQWLASEAFAPLDRALLDIGRGEASLPGLASHTSAWLESVGQADAAARIRETAKT